MTTVDGMQRFLDEGGTVLSWSDKAMTIYYALAIYPSETTQHAMEQEKQLAKGSTLSNALCCLVEKMSGRSDATKALLEVAARLIKWDDELERVGCQSRPPKELIDKARAALELAKWKRK